MTIKWSNDRDMRLRQLHGAGNKAEQVATVLASEFDDFPVTRNAVLGRLWRLGLSVPRTPVGEAARSNVLTTRSGGRPKRARNTTPRPRYESGPDMGWLFPATSRPRPRPEVPVQVPDLLPDHCRWPVTLSRPWGFCGAGRMHGSPYCRTHTIMGRKSNEQQHA
jgi:hypothetical protein